MKGIIIVKKDTWVIIRDENEVTYRCDKRGYDQIETLRIGDRVEFQPNTPKDRKPFASDVVLLKSDLSKEIISFIEQKIQEDIDDKGYFLCAKLRDLFSQCGISNFKEYVVGAKELISTYYSDSYVFHTSLSINGTSHPGVVTPCEGLKVIPVRKQPIVPIKNVESVLTAEEALELKQLFLDGDYEACLLSDIVHSHEFYELAKNDVDTIGLLLICCMQILNLTTEQTYELNRFQKELIRANTTDEFRWTWKKGPAGYPQEIVEECADTSVISFQMPKEIGLAWHLLERLNAGSKPNSTVISLSERFSLSFNELAPATYLLRVAYAYKNPNHSYKVIRETIADYCQFIKSMRSSRHNTCIDLDKHVSAFVRFLNFITTEWNINEFDRGLRINIFSVFLDAGYPNKLSELSSIWSLHAEDEEGMLYDLLQNFEKWTQANVKKLIDLGGSLLLFEKCVAWIWHEARYEASIPKSLLTFLAWTLEECGREVLDEIVKQSFARGFSKREKEIALVSSLPESIELLSDSSSLYGLICYTIKYALPNLGDDDLTDDAKSAIRNWVTVEQRFFDDKLDAKNSDEDRLSQLSTLFTIFKINQDRYTQLQKLYNFELTELLHADSVSTVDFKSFLLKAFSDKAYDAYCKLYEQYQIVSEEQDTECIPQYIESLYEMQLYSRLIQVALASKNLTSKEQEKYIIKALTANFARFGLSQSSMIVFNESFTQRDAIELLENNFDPQNSGLVMSLMALYTKNDDLYKALYLNSIYKKHAAIGFAYLYSQLNSQYGRALNLCRDKDNHENHYVVIEKAFYYLSVDKLWEFLLWAGRIPVPNYDGYLPTHPFSRFFEGILNDPKDVDVWKRQLKHMLDHRSKNTWMICAVAPIMMERFAMPVSTDISKLYLSVMNSEDIEDIPDNFIYFVARYVVLCNGDEAICTKLAKLLESKELKAKLIQTNYWHRYRFEEISSFAEYCNEKLLVSGNYSYYTLVTNLKGNLSSDDLLGLAQFSTNKDLLISQLSQSYLEGQARAEAYKLLSDYTWKDLTYREKAAYEVLKLIYQENDVLVNLYPHLFRDETQILRFKQDCAKILAVYPDSKAFREFDLDCSPGPHKFTVLGFLSKIYYDEDVFEKYQYDYDFLIKSNMEQEFIEYTHRIFEAQLFYNSSYEYFYKQWRYHKLLILEAWHLPEVLNDTDIQYIASQNDQETFVSTPEYKILKSQLTAFVQDPTLSAEQKRMLLYCLADGSMKPYLAHYAESLASITDMTKNAIKQIVLAVDYRDINSSIFEFYLRKIKNGHIEGIRNTVEAVSETAAMAIDQLAVRSKDSVAYQLFEEYAVKKKQGECLSSVLLLDEDKFDEHAELLVPIAASRQLSTKIIDSIRRVIIGAKNGKFSLRYAKFVSYLELQGCSTASAQFKYLYALHLCIEQKLEELQKLIQEDSSLFVGLPLEWEEEAARIKNYAYSNGEEPFVPDGNIGFRTGFGITYSNHGYIELIKSAYQNEDASNENETDKKIREQLAALDSGANSDDDNGLEVKQIEVALLVLETSSMISIEEKLEIIAEVYEYCNVSKKHKERLVRCFNSLFRELSIDSWLRHHSMIFGLLSENGKREEAEEITLICSSILEVCPDILNGETCSTEKALDCYEHLVYPENTVYGRALKDAINTKKQQLKNITKLRIIIENEQSIHDGNIYFAIHNICGVVVNTSEECTINLTVFDGMDHSYVINNIALRNIPELRPKWITGESQNIRKYIADLQIGQEITVKLDLLIGSTLVSSATKTLVISAPAMHNNIPIIDCYDVDKAVTIADELIGRDDIKEKLRIVVNEKEIRYIPQGKIAIYGPSRIGKTSVLNWIRNDLAKEAGNVISILYGGEDIGRHTDYVKSFIDEISDIPYFDDKAMAEYLLIQTIVNALSFPEEGRLRSPFNGQFSEDIKNSIIGIASDDTISIRKRYVKINKILDDACLELWILLDEFQQVVERWKPSEGYHFSSACEMINDKSRIKLVICGSDDLLKHMVLEDNSFWRELFKHRIPVGPLKNEEHFSKMISQNKLFAPIGLKYSNLATAALFSYTGGIALYGKEVCNHILRIVRNGEFGFNERNIIYVADIAYVVQKLLKEQDSEKDVEISEGIRKIYDAVTKNLDVESDMQYLKYIAVWLKSHPESNYFPISVFTQRNLKNKDALFNSLEIAKARMILKEIKDDFGLVTQYDFNTLFYYYAFLGSSRLKLREDLIFDVAEERALLEETEESYSALTDVMDRYDTLSKNDKYRVLSMIFHDNDIPHDDMQEFMARTSTTTTNIGTQYNNNIQITAQTINTAFSTLISDATTIERLEAFKSLPKLADFYTDQERDRMLELQAARPVYEDGDDGTVELSDSDIVVIDEIEEINAKAQNRYYGEMVSTMFKQSDTAPNSSVFAEPTDEELKDVLGIKKTSQLTAIKALPPEYYRQLCFAVALHKMILPKENESIDYSDVDFSPISIMYCKLIEIMLKDNHLKLYGEALPELTITSGEDFSTLNQPEVLRYKWKDITLGTFVWHLIFQKVRITATGVQNNSYFMSRNDQRKDKTPNLERLSDYTCTDLDDWKKHALALAEIVEIRNSSAHGGNAVSKVVFDHLLKVLFVNGGGEIVRIWELYQK